MTGYVNDSIVDDIKNIADIVDIISDYLPLKKSGANYLGLCPFHNEKTPSFSVSSERQFYHCFGCGEGGDVFSFIMKKEGLTFPETIKFLGDKLGVNVDYKAPDQRAKDRKNLLLEINKEAARFFFQNLQSSKEAKDYLLKRGLKLKTLRNFGIGYAKDSWSSLLDHLRSKGYEEEDLFTLGLVGRRSDNKGYYDKFRNRIIFPIINTRGHIIGFGGRVLDDSKPKYLNSQETPLFNKGENLYGINILNKHSKREKIILVEGYMDLISIFNHGINYGVASLGTALTSSQAKLIKRYGNQVYICYDSDLAGVKATIKAAEIMFKESISPKIVLLDGYKDPDDFINAEGLEAFNNKLDEALIYIDFLLYIYLKKYDINKIEDKIKVTKEISSALEAVKDPIEKEIFMKKLGESLNVSMEALRISGSNSKKTYKSKEIIPLETVLPSGPSSAEIELVKIMTLDKAYYEFLNENPITGKFKLKETRIILEELRSQYEDLSIINQEDLYNRLKDKEDLDKEILGRILKEDQTSSLQGERLEAIVRDLINTIELSSLEEKRDGIKEKIQAVDNGREILDSKEFAKLCKDLTDLNRQINLMRQEDGR